MADAFQVLLRSTAGGRRGGGYPPLETRKRKKKGDGPSAAGSAFCECVMCGCSVPRAIYSMHINECLDSSEGRRGQREVSRQHLEQPQVCAERRETVEASNSPNGEPASREPSSKTAKPLESTSSSTLVPSTFPVDLSNAARLAPPRPLGLSETRPEWTRGDVGCGESAADMDANKARQINASWKPAGNPEPLSARGSEREEGGANAEAGGEKPLIPIDLGRAEPLKQARIGFGGGLGLVTHGYQPGPSTVTVLQTGMVLLRNQLDLAMQQRLVDELQSKSDKLHRPHTVGGRKYHLYRMCYGGHGDPAAQQYMGAADTPALPDWLARLGESLGQVAQRHSPVYPPKMRFEPDIAMVNYYPVRSEQLGTVCLGGHVDHDSNSVMPVVSLSIGDSMTFFYRRLPPPSRRPSLLSRGIPLPSRTGESSDSDPADNKEHDVVLKSGDVLVFGGESRMVYHGTRDVLPGTKPLPLRMAPGRLNITLRQHNIPRHPKAIP